MKKHILSLLVLVFVTLALSGCGNSAGEKALAAVRAQEVSTSLSDDDLPSVARRYREVAAQFPDVAERALVGAQRVNAEYERRRAMVREAEERLARSNSGFTY